MNNGSAIAGTDFVTPPLPHNQTLLTNDTQKLIPIDIIPNDTYEGDRAMSLTLSTSDPDIDLQTSVATGMIQEDELPVSTVKVDFGIVSPSVLTEGNSGTSSVFVELQPDMPADGAAVHLSYPAAANPAIRNVDFEGPDTVTLGPSLTQVRDSNPGRSRLRRRRKASRSESTRSIRRRANRR